MQLSMNEDSHRAWEVIIQVVGIGIAITAACVGGVELYHKIDDDMASRADEAKKELRAPFYQAQIDLYRELTQTTGILATQSPSNVDYWPAYRKFGELYYGRLTLFEDEGVERAMVQFSKELWHIEGKRTPAQYVRMQELALNLARECRRSLGRSLTIDFSTMKVKKPELKAVSFSDKDSNSQLNDINSLP